MLIKGGKKQQQRYLTYFHKFSYNMSFNLLLNSLFTCVWTIRANYISFLNVKATI